MVERIDDLELDLKLIRQMAPYAAISYLRKKVGYNDFLSEQGSKLGLDEEDLFKEMWNIEESSRAFASIEKWLNHIKEVTIALDKQDEKREENKKRNRENVHDKAINLMTIHGSKGLEFESVFILGVNEGIIPYRRGIKDNLEEERRLLYVAMTRAKEHLQLTYVQERNGNEQSPSRFVKDLE
jgi:DNA helicase-2/ATP-dependent DNA helicase PcrA